MPARHLGRLFLIIALLLLPLAGPRAVQEPGLAMAMAAGSLCQADGPETVPGGGHGDCLGCQAVTGWDGLVPAWTQAAFADAAFVTALPADQPACPGGWRAYASRAPPAWFD